jgi:hypothetical protein
VLRWQEGPLTGGPDPGGEGRLPGSLVDQLPPPPQLPRRLVQPTEEISDHGRRPRVVEPELELGHHAEVPAAAAKPPEEVGVLGLARMKGFALRVDQLEPLDVVTGKSEPPGQPAHPAS